MYHISNAMNLKAFWREGTDIQFYMIHSTTTVQSAQKTFTFQLSVKKIETESDTYTYNRTKLIRKNFQNNKPIRLLWLLLNVSKVGIIILPKEMNIPFCVRTYIRICTIYLPFLLNFIGWLLSLIYKTCLSVRYVFPLVNKNVCFRRGLQL